MSLFSSNRIRKDRSASAGLIEIPPPAGSPDPTRRNKEKHAGQSATSRLRNTPHGTSLDLTIFHIPGMDVKLHYQSKVLTEDTVGSEDGTPSTNMESREDFSALFRDQSFKESFLSRSYEKSDESRIDKAFKRQDSAFTPSKSHIGDFTSDFAPIKSSTSLHGITNPNYESSPISSQSSFDNFPFQMNVTPPHRSSGNSNINYRAKGVKKASLFAWMTLQSVPEETIISPHILEFLEKTMEPIHAKTDFNTTGK